MHLVRKVTIASILGLAWCSSAGAVETIKLPGDPAETCSKLEGVVDGKIKYESAVLQQPAALSVSEKAPFPLLRISAATPAFCKVVGRIDPVDPAAPPIKFQVNLPVEWNGRSIQHGGGGFNGSLVSGLSVLLTYPYEKPSPLALGYVTYGTDSGHQTAAGEPLQAFAQNDEAFENFAYKSYKKVRDAAVSLMTRVYGSAPKKLYYWGFSEGGREGLTMAQRYPDDFDGIISIVPVINWVGLMHASMRAGLVTMGDNWIRPEQVKLVSDAVVQACDKADGVEDKLVADPVGCKAKFQPESLLCKEGQSGDTCITKGQLDAINAIHSPYKFPFALANGLDDYPGWGLSGEDIPTVAVTGSWKSWWLGTAPPADPAIPSNGRSWFYGSGGVKYIFARDPKLDLSKYRPEDYKTRLLEVSNLMDSTDPDLSKFRAHGGKLIMLESMSDYAQSPFAGIRYFERVKQVMGEGKTQDFARLYTAPNVDHVGSGGPINVDLLTVLIDWVENGNSPGKLQIAEQKVEAPSFPAIRSLPLCEWPSWPHYVGGPVNSASSYNCGN